MSAVIRDPQAQPVATDEDLRRAECEAIQRQFRVWNNPTHRGDGRTVVRVVKRAVVAHGITGPPIVAAGIDTQHR